ncbi:MAG: D-alanyl-D-alanine carboxypeptidase [Candidatus Niyogibacteria bacterium]|nr:D-alanyl-D-alanine carboxypeptidase [Candidatus Niyogibacteria bacterium]
MTFDIRPLTLVAAILVLAVLAPFNAKIAGTFRNFSHEGTFFSLIASVPYASLGGGGSSGETGAGGDDAASVFGSLPLEAASAVVWDVGSGQAIFTKNARQPRALASLTKLMTAVVGERLAESATAEERTVPITPEAIREEGDDGFYSGERFYFSDIRDAMLVKSSNDAAVAIATWAERILQRPAAGPDAAPPSVTEPVFINEMNRVAAEIGLRDTYFLNATGLDLTSERAGAVGTAEDFARLFAWVVKQTPHSIFATQASGIDIVSLDGGRHHFVSSGERALEIPGLLGVKTGFTDLAGGNVAVAWSAFGRSFVAVVLGSSRDGRFEDARALYRSTMDFLTAEE